MEELFGTSSSDDEGVGDAQKTTAEPSGYQKDRHGLADELFGNQESPLAGSDKQENESDMESELDNQITISMTESHKYADSEILFIRIPNFLSVEPRPFNSTNYEDELSDDEALDEEGRARLKLKMENTIRWRNANDSRKESNAKIIEWTDGSMSLHLGSEVFNVFRSSIDNCNQHLFTREGNGLQGQAVLKSKVSVRPHSTDSQTHRKMTLSIADKCSKAQKIFVLPAVDKNPEYQRHEMIKKEEERLRASIRRENQQRRVRERSHASLTPSYLEMMKRTSYAERAYEDDNLEEFGTSEEESEMAGRESKAAMSESDDEFYKRSRVEADVVNKRRRIFSQAVVPSDDEESP